MKKLFTLFAAAGLAICANAQLHEKKVVKAGDNIALAISPNGFYRFPQFTEGVFTMKDGVQSKAMFNYHIGNGDMEYISDKGDTLAIGIPDQIRNIMVGENQFIYTNKSYLEIIAEAKPAKLAKKIRVTIENEKKGGYGESAPASSQANLKNFTLSTGIYQLTHDVAIIKTTSLYWVDGRNSLTAATKKNSVKLVSKDKQPKLEAFIEENNTNFNSEGDLRKLLQYADTL